MDDKYLTRLEHNEYCKRMESEHARFSKRLEILENLTERINELAISTNSLAESVARMSSIQTEHNKRLDSIELRDGEMWRQVVGHIITGAIGVLIGFLFKQIGIF